MDDELLYKVAVVVTVVASTAADAVRTCKQHRYGR